MAPYTHAVVIASTQDAEKLKKYNSEFLNNYYANAKIPTDTYMSFINISSRLRTK